MIRIKDKSFEVSIPNEEIQQKVKALAEKMNKDYAGKNPVFVCILNGAFVFMADLVRYLDFQPDIVFAKYSSYEGMNTTGKVKEVLGVSVDLEGKDVVLVEDIIDTGITMSHVLPIFQAKGVASVKIATMLMKPEKLKCNIKVDYCAMEIPNDFIVGYGLDYDGLGRNYKDIYTVVED
jgi:hypoxanthine phosphoribosyltransferase